MRRRQLLSAVGAGVVGGLAGCAGVDSGPTPEDGDTPSRPDSSPVPDHPATVGLEDQPLKGELGGDLVVAFEDPSCPRCRAFEEETVPKIESNLVETGKAAYAFRGYPVVYPWGKPAAHALEATFVRSESAHWELLAHYFDSQPDSPLGGGGSGISADNVVERTAQFLNSETDVDGDTVAEDTRNDAYKDAVQADLAAGMSADVGQTTPTILLFRDGAYLTRASGSVSYELIATALGE